jgi:DNA-binding NarL/FixJ family response regulator
MNSTVIADQLGDGGLADRRLRILLAGGQRLSRDAVRTAFELEADLEIVGEVEEPALVAEQAQEAGADVILIDLTSPERWRSMSLAQIKQAAPDARILVLASEGHEEGIAEALEGGASGYVTTECGLPSLLEAVRTVSAGGMQLPNELLNDLLDRLLRRQRAYDDALELVSCLTPRERQVLVLLVDGADTRAIAAALVISPATAKTHVQNVLRKLAVHSRSEAVALVLGNGIAIELELDRPRTGSSPGTEALGYSAATRNDTATAVDRYSSIG